MQAIKEKIQDMNTMRKVKAQAKAEEKAEKELAKARLEIAREVRLAKEAEAQMEFHVAKAGEKAEKQITKHEEQNPASHHANGTTAPGATATAAAPLSTATQVYHA